LVKEINSIGMGFSRWQRGQCWLLQLL